MEDLSSVLSSFDQITLSEMDAVKLMNRTDTKFLISRTQLLELLKLIKVDYRSLNVEQSNLSHYSTLYYDTPDFLFYRSHHNGKKNRKKVRFRKYVDSDLSFLEVKHKDNKSRTDKKRIVVANIEQKISQASQDFLDSLDLKGVALEPKLWNDFHRITLADKTLQERATIDTNMTLTMGEKKKTFPNMAIIEVKQEQYNRNSPIMLALKKLHIRQKSMSKYCIGVALMNTELKTNNFKESIRFIQKIAS